MSTERFPRQDDNRPLVRETHRSANSGDARCGVTSVKQRSCCGRNSEVDILEREREREREEIWNQLRIRTGQTTSGRSNVPARVPQQTSGPDRSGRRKL